LRDSAKYPAFRLVPADHSSIYAYDSDNLIEETNATGTAVARHSQGLNIIEPLAILRGGTTSYYQADGLGSITSLSNTAGALAHTYRLDSFGNQRANIEEFIEEYYNRQRLHPALGSGSSLQIRHN
jgi:hypothetical protein